MIRFRNHEPPPEEGPNGGLPAGPGPGSDPDPDPAPNSNLDPDHDRDSDRNSDRNSAPDLPPEPSEASRRMATLVDRIATLAAHLTAATYQLLVWIREFDELFQKCGFGTGFRTSAEWLAWRTSMSLTAARERVRVARALADLPATSRAMARGELSYSKVRAICRAAPLDRETEEKLLHFARHGTASHLERLIRSWRRMGELTKAAEEKARHDRRYLRLRPDEDGSWVIQGRLDPEVGAVVKRVLEMGVEALYRRDRLKEVVEEERTGRKVAPDPAGQEWVDQGRRRADALGLVAEAALKVGERSGNGGPGVGLGAGVDRETDGDAGENTGADIGDDSAESPKALELFPDTRSERYQVVVHVDLATLNGNDPGEGGRAGAAADAEEEARPSPGLSLDRFSFLDDELRVPAETARRLCCGGGRVVMVNDGEGGVLDVGRRTRVVPSALARAVRFRDRGRCRFPGCTAPGRDHHHAVHWARGGETKLENLVMLCWFHHRAVHEGGFGVEATDDGDFRFRHPSGTVLEPAPALPPVEDDPIRWVRERVEGWLEEEGWVEEEGRVGGEGSVGVEDSGGETAEIGPWTLTGKWDGRPPDLSIILGQLPPWGSGQGEGEGAAEV